MELQTKEELEGKEKEPQKEVEESEGIDKLTDALVESEAKEAEASEEEKPEETPSEEAEYTPNLKFKAMGKEMEFDEELRPFITNEQVEKKFRELHEKAYGLDHVKTDRQALREELDGVKKEHTELKGSVEFLGKYLEQGDLESFCRELNISETDILKFAATLLQRREMPPEQRQVHEGYSNLKREVDALKIQNSRLSQGQSEGLVAARMMEMDNVISDPNVSAVAKAFDERVGKPGAFREEVILRGRYHWQTYQKDIPAKQAVDEVLNLIGGTVAAPPPQQVAETPAPQQQASNVKVVHQKPAIPNIQGKGTSPAKKVFKTLEDIEEHRDKLLAEEGAST